MLSPEELNSTLLHSKYETGVEVCLYQLEWELRQKINPSFRRSITRINDHLDQNDGRGTIKQTTDVFVKAVEETYNEVEKFWRWAGARDSRSKFRARTIAMTKAAIFHTLWPELRRVVRYVYEKTFAAFYQSESRGKVPPSSPEDGACNVCEKLKMKCECWFLVTQFRLCNERLLELELLDRIAGNTVTEIARSTIEKQVQDISSGSFDMQHLDTMTNWLQTTLFKWLEEVYVFSRPNQPKRSHHSTPGRHRSAASTPSIDQSITSNQSDDSVDMFSVPPSPMDSLTSTVDGSRRGQLEFQKRRLSHFLHESYACYLIDRLFDIIVDYPDSKPALIDLKRCMTWAAVRPKLTECLRGSLERRLLHPGVNTSDILSAYIQTVYSLRLLDASGVLMENVCQPVRQYLRQRPDTVRCIVSYLTDNGGLELNSAFMSAADQSLSFNDSGTALGLDEPVSAMDGSKEDEEWTQWVADPTDAAPESVGRARRSADVISMLVGVYGSREQFVKEYCQLLAERLLRQNTYNIDDELRYLELLKLRIGEAELNQCEVMLKDVKDSQRIDSFVNSQPTMKECSIPVSALVVSSYFWPTLKEERLELPERIKVALEAYAKCFEMQKASRTLDWKTNLGVVELELEMGGRQVPVYVTPILASIIMQFEKKETWTAESLATELKMPVAVLKRRIAWWTGVEIVKEISNGTYQLCTELPAMTSSKQRRFSCGVEDDDDDDGEGSSENAVDKVEQLETYWPYIMGLLTSFEELAAERIHTLLRMFCSQGQEPTLETVHMFLQRKVRDQYLTYVGGSYKLQKK